MLENLVRVLYPSFAFSRREEAATGNNADDEKNRQDCAEPELRLPNQLQLRLHTHQDTTGSSIARTTVKAERGQPVAAHRVFRRGV